jgi:hypothetical protein
VAITRQCLCWQEQLDTMECSMSTVRIALKPKFINNNLNFLAALDQILTLLNLTEDEFFITKKLARIVVEFAGKSDFNFVSI